MNTNLTPQEAVAKAGSVQELAQLLGVKRQAVEQWLKRDPPSIPPARVLQLMQLKPRWFKEKK